MPLDIDALNAWEFEDLEHSYTKRDTMLYALGLGFGEDPSEEKELAYVYEDGLLAAPSMARHSGISRFLVE